MLRQNFKHTKRTMLQPTAICRNRVQSKLQAEMNLCYDKEFYVVTLLKKNEKKTVATPLTLSLQ